MREFKSYPANGIYTRKLARSIAKAKMKAEGMKQFCKSHRYVITAPTGKKMSMKDPSTFSQKWRDYVGESMIYG